MTSETPFLIDPDNHTYVEGRGLAVPQRPGSAQLDLTIGGLVGAAAVSLLPILLLLDVDLGIVPMLIILAGAVGALIFAAGSVRNGWRALARARAFRERAHRCEATFTHLELVDEGGGDWFLKGNYSYTRADGQLATGTFARYRPDLVTQPLPPAGTPALVLAVDDAQLAEVL